MTETIQSIFVFSESDAESRPVGILCLTLGHGIHGLPLLNSLLVDSTMRRKGVATRLLRRAEDKAKELKMSSIFAVTHPSNEPTRSLLNHLGYTEMILFEKHL